MDFSLLAGSSAITQLLLKVSFVFVAGDLLITVFTIAYHRYFYDRFLKPRYNNDYSPRCAIIIPCKGVAKDLVRNLKGFLSLDYSEYRVVYAVESERDDAVPVIKEIVANDARARLAVAGLSQHCAQKNHNLLAGLRETDDAEVYVFADADIKPEPGWLKELILPLAHPKVAATTGFRWLQAKKGTVGELAHFYVNAFMYVLFVTACFFGGVGLWGGSMAIRRKDFDELNVADKWARAGVDDMSLSYLVLKKRRKAVLVPHCVIHTDDLIPTLKGTVRWFERQIMYLKAYQKALWLFIGFPMVFFGMSFVLLLPIALLVASLFGKSFFASGGGAALVFYIGELLTVSLYPFIGVMHSAWKFYLLWPFLRVSQGISYLMTALTNTITWAGIKYKMAFNGDVVSVKRP